MEPSIGRSLGIAPDHCSTAAEAASPSPRPGDGTSSEQSCLARSEPNISLAYAAAAAAGFLPQTNSAPSTQVRCSTVASFSASASFALRMPHRLATSMAQRLSVLNLVARVSSALAASCKAVRTPASPTFVIVPVMSSPGECSHKWVRKTPQFVAHQTQDMGEPRFEFSVEQIVQLARQQDREPRSGPRRRSGRRIGRANAGYRRTESASAPADRCRFGNRVQNRASLVD